MNADLLRKHLALAPATAKGRLRRPPKGLRSTRNSKQQQTQPPITQNVPHIIQNKEEQPANDGMNNVFCFAALADKQKGTMYTDATGALPAVSLEGNQYFFVAYD